MSCTSCATLQVCSRLLQREPMNATVIDSEAAGASASAIRHHYDLSNDFYALWLDQSRTYSAALWEQNDTLETAQERKLDYHAKNCDATSGKDYLDVGCGWGSTLFRLVNKYQARSVIGLTLSDAQARYIEQRSVPGVTVKVEGWQAFTPPHAFDGIISIGAFEHFAKPDLSDDEMIEAYRAFFLKCHEWLKPGCSLSLQTIAYGRAKRADINKFVLEHIFPESDLPALWQIVKAVEGLFDVVSFRNDRNHYADTFRHWATRLSARRAEAVALVGKEKVETYQKYQGLFTIGFHTGAMDLYRLHLRRIGK
jgi:cyclopropane-fatty-acyl-phospholipid synthase